MKPDPTQTSVILSSGARSAGVWKKAGKPEPGNQEFTLKSGAVGTVMAFRLSDHSGGVSLSRCVVTVSIQNANSKEICINAAPCMPHDNQFQNAGFGTYTFDADSGNLAEGNYLMEFAVTRESGTTELYPTGKFINFVKLTVQPSLANK